VQIEQAYEQRNLGVTLFRAVFVTLLLAGIFMLYLLSHATRAGAIYGGVSMLLVSALTFAASLIVYAPANQQLRNVYSVPTFSIFKHQSSAVVDRKRSERDLFDRLEKDLEF
jgi:formate/nitrite transporter FocA (FNT family)